jgi:hypothetical protein
LRVAQLSGKVPESQAGNTEKNENSSRMQEKISCPRKGAAQTVHFLNAGWFQQRGENKKSQ